ncbi:MAG TPA: tetratricopeptide repeat protein, partial [Pirellulaceae bacterium]|nr:tetratricopeptide repeat protein [Pirellulaceae bacterium]
ENHDHVETTLRGWMVKNSESKQIDDATKAKVQLLLARNYVKAQRYDIARNEYTTVVNRYPNTPQSVEAEFGIGETYMAQKVFDQAELVFERLARHPEADVVVRAEFLRGVLAFRRGDREEARDIFRGVLERVPNVDLANQALFSLSEVYGAEERYMDQLNLLRTVGRLGRSSKRRHMPGQPLSIVVHDSDLGISRGHNRIPVRVTTEPGGDSELIYLTSAGAGKGLFRVDLETRLGQATADDHVLQLTGKDVIKCDYPPEFKAEFKNVPLSDVEIRVASDAKLDAASSRIVDKQAKSFSQQLQEEAADSDQADKRVSQFRPENQIKPGNVVYLRVKDADRDLSNEQETVIVKLTADSGDQVQVQLQETGPHTGVFEGTAMTGELPAGARASDTAIDHNPLMAIDRDPKTFWMSAPDGATPKSLTVDLKDLRPVARARYSTPDVARNAPVRGELFGSQDGEFWFRIAANPPVVEMEPVSGEYASMRRRVWQSNLTQVAQWAQVVALTKNTPPLEDEAVDELSFQRTDDADDAKKPFTVVWSGKLVQPRDGAARIRVDGARTALSIDGREELPLGAGGRTVDVWLSAGAHDLTIFAATASGQQPVQAVWARADLNSAQITLAPFRKQDFDTKQAVTRPRPLAGVGASRPVDLGVETAQFNKKTEKFGRRAEANDRIGNWAAADDWVYWEFAPAGAGPYEVWLNFAHAGAGGAYQIELGRQTIKGAVADTGGADKFRIVRAGTVLIDSIGKQTLALKPTEIKGDGLMELRGVTLKPATGANVIVAETDWEFRFPAVPLRFTRLVVHEYRGEAVAINHVEIGGVQGGQIYIPTKTDVLGLAKNNVLEIAGGDTVT